jgi:hypothetical protein
MVLPLMITPPDCNSTDFLFSNSQFDAAAFEKIIGRSKSSAHTLMLSQAVSCLQPLQRRKFQTIFIQILLLSSL